MAHNIYQRKNGKHSVFTVGEPAWHKLGKTLDNPLTSVEAIEEAGLDYHVEKQEVFCKVPSDNQIVLTGDTFVRVPDKFSTVRMDTNTPLGIVGNRYTVLQNADAFKFFDSVVGGGHAMYHSAGALGEGERIWIMAKLPNDIIIKGEDVVEQYLVLTNSHDGSGAVQMFYTPIRVVCQNTLNWSMQNISKGIKMRHTININGKINDAKKILGLMLDYETSFEGIAQQMANVSFDVKSADAYFTNVLGGEPEEDNVKTLTRFENQKDMLLTLFEKGVGNDKQAIRHTAWTAYNAVTEYVDYHKATRGSDDNRLKSIWFGTGAELKSKAFELATTV